MVHILQILGVILRLNSQRQETTVPGWNERFSKGKITLWCGIHLYDFYLALPFTLYISYHA